MRGKKEIMIGRDGDSREGEEETYVQGTKRGRRDGCLYKFYSLEFFLDLTKNSVHVVEKKGGHTQEQDHKKIYAESGGFELDCGLTGYDGEVVSG